jgi:hypothetical protein
MTMTQLEFREKIGGPRISTVSTTSDGTIPCTGDVVYVPHVSNPGVYVHLRIGDRHFYYDQQGGLTVVCLTCEVLAGLPAGQDVAAPPLPEP